MERQPIIETINLTKTYNGFTAVDHLNLRVGEGEIFGFLGPNGAGKTTTILMLLGLTEPTSGMARVCGYNSTREPLKVKRIAAYLPEHLGFYEDMTARENLEYIARLNAIPDNQAREKARELLSLVGLGDVTKQKVETFSRGMKQRLGIASVLIKEPKVVFLDEPTSGIDPQGTDFILDLITRMSKEQNITLLLSSHLLHQVQRVCHRVGILSGGRLVAEGSLEHLASVTLGEGQLEVEVELAELPPNLVDTLQHIEGVTHIEKSANRLIIACHSDIRPQISRAILDSGSSLMRLGLRGYGLEEIYMRYFHER